MEKGQIQNRAFRQETVHIFFLCGMLLDCHVGLGQDGNTKAQQKPKHKNHQTHQHKQGNRGTQKLGGKCETDARTQLSALLLREITYLPRSHIHKIRCSSWLYLITHHQFTPNWWSKLSCTAHFAPVASTHKNRTFHHNSKIFNNLRTLSGEINWEQTCWDSDLRWSVFTVLRLMSTYLLIYLHNGSITFVDALLSLVPRHVHDNVPHKQQPAKEIGTLPKWSFPRAETGRDTHLDDFNSDCLPRDFSQRRTTMSQIGQAAMITQSSKTLFCPPVELKPSKSTSPQHVWCNLHSAHGRTYRSCSCLSLPPSTSLEHMFSLPKSAKLPPPLYLHLMKTFDNFLLLM